MYLSQCSSRRGSHTTTWSRITTTTRTTRFSARSTKSSFGLWTIVSFNLHSWLFESRQVRRRLGLSWFDSRKMNWSLCHFDKLTCTTKSKLIFRFPRYHTLHALIRSSKVFTSFTDWTIAPYCPLIGRTIEFYVVAAFPSQRTYFYEFENDKRRERKQLNYKRCCFRLESCDKPPKKKLGDSKNLIQKNVFVVTRSRSFEIFFFFLNFSLEDAHCTWNVTQQQATYIDNRNEIKNRS